MTAIILTLYAVLPIMSWAIYKKFFRTKKGWMAAFTLTVIGGSLLYVFWIHMIDAEYYNDLMRYDSNKDGEFSEVEYTSEARAAMKRSTDDTGRSLAPIVAPVATIMWTAFMFGVCRLFARGFQDIRDLKRDKLKEQ